MSKGGGYRSSGSVVVGLEKMRLASHAKNDTQPIEIYKLFPIMLIIRRTDY